MVYLSYFLAGQRGWISQVTVEDRERAKSMAADILTMLAEIPQELKDGH